MTPDEFREAIDKLGMSQEAAGVWLGLSPRAGQRYATGDAAIPGPVAKLIRLVIRLRIDPAKVK